MGGTDERCGSGSWCSTDADGGENTSGTRHPYDMDGVDYTQLNFFNRTTPILYMCGPTSARHGWVCECEEGLENDMAHTWHELRMNMDQELYTRRTRVVWDIWLIFMKLDLAIRLTPMCDCVDGNTRPSWHGWKANVNHEHDTRLQLV